MESWVWTIDGWIILVGVLSACSCTLLGNYLVLRKMSLMGDAISHAVLPGLAIAFLVSGSRSALPMLFGAIAAGALTTVLTEAVVRFGKVEQGAAMGVVFSVLFALGLILIRQAADHVDLDPGCVLYGNIAQIPLDAFGETLPPAAINLLIVMALNLLCVGLFYKELKITTFDPELASALGINAQVVHYGLMILVAITTVANFESVGSILVIAMLIVPAAAAHLLTERLGSMILVSLVIAAASAVIGHILAAFGPGWLGIAAATNTSAMIAVVAGAFLFVAILAAPQHGAISRLYHRLALRRSIVQEDILGLLHRLHEMAPAQLRPVGRQDVVLAVGDTLLSRRGLRALERRGYIESAGEGRGRRADRICLSAAGLAAASGLVRSHRLWEAYIAKHFELPLDHLHFSAERAEHFITPAMRQELSADLTGPQRDPHGKEIPPEAEQKP